MAQFIPFTPEEQEEYKKKAGLLPSTGVVEPPEPKRATGSFVPLEPEERKGILADRLVLAAREGYEEQPEDYARRLQLARSNGWPEWMVSDPEIRKEAELNELGRKLTELPEDYSRTSSVLGIPRNFTLFRDDVETLKGVEDAVKGASAVTPMGRATVAFDEPEKDLVAEFFRHSGKGFSNVMELYRYAELSAKERTEGLADEERAEWDALQSRLVPEEAPTLWEQVQQGAGSSLAFQVRPLSRFLSRWGIPLALATAGAAALAGTGGTAAPLIGALTPAAKALALGGAIGATGYRVQSFMDYQGLATELSYRTLSQMTDDRGVPYAEILGEGTISRLARGIGLAASTMESVGLEAVLGMVPGIGSLIPAKGMTRSVLMQPTIQKAILTGLANAFRTWSVEVGTEVAEQAVTTGGEEFAKWMVEQSGGRVSYADAGEWAARLGEEAVGAGAAFLLGVGVGPGMMNVAGNVAQVNAAKRAQKTFLTLVELAEQSRGFKRSPDDGASVVSGIVAGSPVETTYVAARQFVEAYQQLGVDPAVVAETLGVSRESLAEALETEGRIAVPTGEWTAKVAGTEAGRALLGDLTFESDGMTLREAQLAERELTELMRREAKAAEEAFKADEVLNQELESVRTDFLTQATGAGLDAETAQADAEVWAAFARTAYRRFGIRPREFSDMVGLEIRQGLEVAAGEEALYQTAFHGSPYRFSRFSLDHVGEGEGAQAFGWGLYFAGSRDVAEWYRSKLQDGSPVIKNDDVTYMDTNDGWRFSSDQNSDDWSEFNVNIPEVQAEVDGLDLFRAFGYDKEAAEEAIDQALQHPEAVSNAILGDILDSREGRARLERAREFLGNSDLQTVEPGQLYAVDIPGSESLLDWDKPLSEQPEKVREALARIEEELGWSGSALKSPVGRDLYRHMEALVSAEDLSGNRPGGVSQAVSEILNDYGIKGIKYLDGTSRADGDGSYNYVIFDDAAIDVLETFYQQARGQAAFPSGQSIVTLFETADRSTLLHEMGHVFLNGLGLMAQRNEAAATEWAVVMDFLGVDDWDALTPEERTEAHETFARAFEAYLMEGKAPSTALQRAFRMFKSWLIDIYRNLMGLSRQAGRDVALSDEARDIFSRLLATDEEIAEAAALAPFLAAVEATDESRELHREATAQAAEEAGRIRSAAEMRARRKEVAAQVRQELEASRGYRALFAMQRSADKGGRKINEDEFIERYGEMAWSESARPLGITSKRSTWALDDLALSLGYLTADEMVEEVLALPPLKDALAAQVDLVMAQEAQQEALSAEAALRNDARLEALILEHDSLAGDGTDVPRDAVDAPAWVQLLEEVEAEEQNPLSRENVLAEIRERGGIRYESIKAVWGPGEAKALRERLGPGPFRKDGRGLDQLVDELRADGIPVESTQALYDILLGEGGPQRQELDVAVDAESLPWLVWMLGRDETRDYLGKRRRAVRNALKEATEAFEADRSDEARQARVAAQRELDYIKAALTELEKDVDPDARYRVDFDPATLGQPREGRATWSQPTVREALAEQMKGTDPVKMRDAWALASRIARSAVGESRKQAREAQKALREQVREVARARQAFQAQQRATVRARVEAARVSARKVLENRKASEVNPREFIRAEREAARNVERALKDNNFDEAARQKDIEIINAALAYEAGRTKLEVGKIRAYLDKMAKRRKPGTLGADYLDRIHAVLEGVAFKKTRSRKAEQELAGFLEWKKEQESLGEVVAVPDRLVEQMGRVRFDSLTVGELREIHDSVRNLEHLGRTKTRLLTDRRKRDFETAVGDLLKSVDENLGAPYKTDLTPDKTLGQKAASALRAADAMHRRMEFLLRKLDGNRDLGTAWDLIFRPIVDAERAEIVLREEAAQRLQALFERLGKVNLQSKRFYREVDMRLSKENLLAIALNMGNEGNRDRLLSGHGWSEAQVMGLLQHLSRGEWEWVQGVWDFLDSFWPQVAALEKEMAGVEPRRVERMPFVARGSDGSEIELSGGYYPIAYDASKSPQAFEIEEKRHVQDAMATQSYRAATRHGHTKARAGHAEIPLSLNLSTISRHVQEVVHDLTHRRAIRDVGRILEDRRVQKAITEALGAEYWREFKPWLKHVAAGRDATPLNAWEQFLSHTRQGVTIATLGAKATTAIMQVMSIFGAAERIGALHMMNSIQEFYRNPAAWREKTQFVYDRSPEIRNRRRNWDRDVRDTLARNVGKGKKARVLEMAFWAAGMMDAAAVVPTWREAYQMKLAETGSEETAIHFADSVVRQTQPANSPKDLASVMRGHETRKLFTMFYSYWSVFYNLAASRIGATRRIGDLPRLAGSFLFMVAVPAVLGPLLTRRGPDDDEDPLGWAAKQMLLFPFNALIGMRDVVSYVANPQWGYRLTPASRGFESAGNLVVQAKQALFDGDDWEDVIRPAVDLIGIWGHLPTDQARVTIGQFLRYLAGDMPDYDVADLFFRHRQ